MTANSFDFPVYIGKPVYFEDGTINLAETFASKKAKKPKPAKPKGLKKGTKPKTKPKK